LRQRLDTDVRREQLLEVGLAIFGSRPLGEVSMSAVAAEAGVSHGLLFHYFGSKRGYYTAIVRWVTDRLVAATEPDPQRSPQERLRDGLRAHVEFAESHPVGYTAIVGGGDGADEEVQAICEEARGRAARNLLDAIGMESPPARVRIAVRGWQGFVEGAIADWIKSRDLEREALIELMASALPAVLQLTDDQ
jgi:AcrR family transcriptional regulator